jgi:hypothetical protein
MSQIPPFQIIRASRRSISLQISQTKGLIVRAPFSVPEDIIHAFVDRKSDWIKKHLQTHTEQKHSSNNILYYLGQSHSTEYNLLQKEPLVQEAGIFTFSGKIQETENEKLILTHWYKEQSRKYLTERVEYFAEKHNLTYGDIRITSAVTRWGSCSSHDNLNFPWRLLMAPTEVIDYVVVHELAHTVHKNHSAHFWKLVESIEPKWKRHRNHLQKE